MKIQTFFAIAALTCGAAFAQAASHTAGSPAAGNQSSPSATHRTSTASHTRAGVKTRHALHRMGQKTRMAMHRVAHPRSRANTANHRSESHSMHSGTRSMGASNAPDSGSMDTRRRSRMDQAYATWSARHQ